MNFFIYDVTIDINLASCEVCPFWVSVLVLSVIPSVGNTALHEGRKTSTLKQQRIFVLFWGGLVGHRATPLFHASVPGFSSESDASEMRTVVMLGRRPPPAVSLLQLPPLPWC